MHSSVEQAGLPVPGKRPGTPWRADCPPARRWWRPSGSPAPAPRCSAWSRPRSPEPRGPPPPQPPPAAASSGWTSSASPCPPPEEKKQTEACKEMASEEMRTPYASRREICVQKIGMRMLVSFYRHGQETRWTPRWNFISVKNKMCSLPSFVFYVRLSWRQL